MRMHGAGLYDGYRVQCLYEASTLSFGLFVWDIKGMVIKQIGGQWYDNVKVGKDYHRLAILISGNQLTCQLDALPPVTVKSSAEIRGKVSLSVGTTRPSPRVAFRNFQVRPLPADQPSDEELREKAKQQQQHAITAFVEDAKLLIAEHLQHANCATHYSSLSRSPKASCARTCASRSSRCCARPIRSPRSAMQLPRSARIRSAC
jgi:hypothetical protein